MVGSSHLTIPPRFGLSWFERTTIMFKKLAFFALFLAVAGLFATTSVNAQRLIKRTVVKSADTIYSVDATGDTLVPEAVSANLDQCHNGAYNGVVTSPQDCTGSNWANGNANENNSHYIEDGHIRYRLGFGGLTIGQTYTINVNYDRLQGSDHAIDYLTTYNAEASATVDPNGWDSDYAVIPCDSAASPCTLVPNTTAIPTETAMAPPNDAVEAGVFTMWGGNFGCPTCGAVFTIPGDGTSAIRGIAITFVADTTNPMMAWSGHIASRADWTPQTTAISDRTGSPYHMRIESNGTFNGQQDRSLKGAAVILLPPSAADASIAGRVVDGYGRAISGAKITLYDLSSGEIKYAYTNTLGYYKIEGLELGNLFLATAEARRFTFVNGSLQFSLDNNLSSLNFQASR